jgi:NADH-quinone oxidoreductase subunit E
MSCDKGCAGVVTYDYEQLDKVLEEYECLEGSLITILQKAQDIYGFLPREVMKRIAGAMNLKISRIYGVATFYTQFRFEPVGKYLIMLCMGTACHVNGAKMIDEAICDELGIVDGETTRDGLFTLNNVACIGCCSLSPVMMINGETYGLLTDEKVRQVLGELRAQAQEQEAGA